MASAKKAAKRAKQSQLTVMQVLPNLGAGGAEQTTVDVTAALIAAGHRAVVVSNGGSRVIEIQRAGGIHIEMPVHSKSPFTMWLNTQRLRLLIRKYNVDIVHARSRAPAWSCFWACQKSSAKFMTTCHAPFNIGSEFKRHYNSSIAKGELVIANSEFVAHYLVDQYAVPHEKIRVIPRGIPMEKFDPARVKADRMLRLAQSWRIPDVSTVVLLPGRLTRWKGQMVMIDAMAKLKTKDVYCVMVGDDQGRVDYRMDLEDLIHAHGIEDRVRIVGHCDDMQVAYMLADVVVSASIEPEGFGRVAVEGQSMGRPVIATAIGGSKETIVDGKTGWLVPPNDAEALAKGVDFALSLTDQEKHDLALSAMHHARTHFTKEQMTFATLLVYAELVGDRNGR
ncbi:MAG TPA: glycosyltransferase family 4 protein [Alphaproteobacteria bacterium]|nr:glycosyltransferase family 4 protein [Alphaproteobacteria bacterium]